MIFQHLLYKQNLYNNSYLPWLKKGNHETDPMKLLYFMDLRSKLHILGPSKSTKNLSTYNP